ncbi:hypothetical protein M3649_10035 [Ureibacillus chungkukjangi]|uniref:Uncharacterized protein n=2 Tax=Ureibacillus chungkukjangi TaxID=1202712 RepID=A0A318TR08_9BACL|nr:hypothetical protein [Ureibacillus chungkukjangi]MCM3388476.1 hypothetical protein [Ureibacillus chungkukjangi]PYF07276.1 hypothetical protein BJ095_10566 [Ureibacillus chungkukjangi]
MNLFRGDAHKIYCHLKKNSASIASSKYLKEMKEVRDFYQSITSDILKLIFYRLIKEKNGSGMIPVYVSSIPFLFLIFSNSLQKHLFAQGSKYWLIFIVIYLGGITFSLFLHFREKAWAASHIEIIQDILTERKDN